MKCDIYKSGNLKNSYLFVPAEAEPHRNIPEPVLKQLGELVFFKSIEFEEDASLIAANPKEIIENINKKGFHLQSSEIRVSVKGAREISEAGAAIGGGILAASLGFGPIGAIAGAIIGALVASSAKGEKNDPDA